jgi:hypothetical protein
LTGCERGLDKMSLLRRLATLVLTELLAQLSDASGSLCELSGETVYVIVFIGQGIVEDRFRTADTIPLESGRETDLGGGRVLVAAREPL